MKSRRRKTRNAIALVLFSLLLTAPWGCSEEKGEIDAYFVRNGLMLKNQAAEDVSVSNPEGAVWKPGQSRLLLRKTGPYFSSTGPRAKNTGFKETDRAFPWPPRKSHLPYQ